MARQVAACVVALHQSPETCVNQLGFSLGAIGFRREDFVRSIKGERLCDKSPSTTDGKIG